DDAPASVAVGATDDPESALIAHIYAAALRFYGSPAHVALSEDPLTELDSGDARVVPGFTGRLLHRFVPDSTARSATQVYREMVSALPEGIGAGDYTTSAEDKPALAVTEKTAEAWGGRDLTAAVRHCDDLEVGKVASGAIPP
ncbi:glycine betaine ABC transporter substrate-binding protein, partial [Mycolicibacter minnesotensis]|uniref:glycine betaine ABC transporter substrate-binding protein n=2 Tax=Mycobacteriaceae TaxID=1762 RepID=UPI0023E01297